MCASNQLMPIIHFDLIVRLFVRSFNLRLDARIIINITRHELCL